MELHGFDATTLAASLRGAGKAYLNIDLTQLDDPTETDPVNASLVGSIAIGATRGGLNFSITPVYQNVDFDGVTEATKNNKRLIYNEVRLGFSAGKNSIANLLAFIDRSKSTVIANGLTRIEEDIAACDWPDYLTNIAFLTTYGDCAANNPYPAVFVLLNPLNSGGVTIQTQDQGVAVSDVEFMAHYDPATPLASPYRLYVKTPA
jgi:hypothetical protein